MALGITMTASRAQCLVAIVASAPREGVTTVTVNLARILQDSFRRRVLIADVCLASPALHAQFGVPLAPGLAEVLRGEAALQDAIQLSEDGTLGILPAGKAGPGEQALLLSGSRLPRVLDQMRHEQFDLCLLDCPSLLDAPEAAIAARYADTTYCVVRAERTSWQTAEKATDSLRAADCNLGGVVLNRTVPHIPKFLRNVLQRS